MDSVPGPVQVTGWVADPRSPSNCYVVGCGQYCGSPEILRHVEQTHIYAQHPGGGEPNSSHGGHHPLRNASSVPLPKNSNSPTYGVFQQPVLNHIQALVSKNPRRPLPTQASTPSPPVQQQVSPPIPAGQPSRDQNALSEISESWPAMAHVLLKNLIIAHGVFTMPQNAQEHDKLVELFEKFHADTKILGMNIAPSDEALWQLFTLKVGVIQAELLAQRELISTAQGLVVKKLALKNLSVITSRQEPLSTPPTTPSLPPEQLKTVGLALWNSLDANAQAGMLRTMLRGAKNPERIVSECEEYCTEIRRNEDKEARDGIEEPPNSHPRNEMTPRPNQSPSASKTPDPVSEGLDLQAMIEESIQKARLKRALEKEARETLGDKEEDPEAKRARFEPQG